MTESENEPKSSISPNSVTGEQPAKSAPEITLDPLPVVPVNSRTINSDTSSGTNSGTTSGSNEVLAYLKENEVHENALFAADSESDYEGYEGDETDSDDEADAPGKVMTVIEHLDELRGRILRGLGAFVCTMVVALWVGKDVIVWLEKPAGHMTFQALSLEEPILVYFKVSFYLAIVLASPFILGEFAAFIWPGLKKKEKQVLLPIVVGAPLLFVAGALFAYYLALPPMLYFFNSFGQAMTPINQRLDYYISLVLTAMMYMGLCFQLPVILFCLSFAGIVTSSQLLKVWRYAIIVSSLVAAVVTPDPTVISMLIVMAALVGLYFGSVVLLKLFGK